MSYNITSWRTIELKNFVLLGIMPFDVDDVFIAPDSVDPPTHIINCNYGSYTNIEGKYQNDTFIVKFIGVEGECSGGKFNDFLGDVLMKSTGYMKAILIWECGDSVEELIVNDGEIQFNPYVFK
jgi:hypothetical protein